MRKKRIKDLYMSQFECCCSVTRTDLFVCLLAGQAEGQTSPGQMVDEPIHPVNIPRREKDFQGMLEYKKEDELKLIKNLILGKDCKKKSWDIGYKIVKNQTFIMGVFILSFY